MKDAINFYYNEYVYMLTRHVKSDNGQPAIIFCYGVNTKRFHPITHNKHGIGSNPAFRGLQMLQAKTIIPETLEQGGTVVQVCHDHCEPSPVGDSWWKESVELHKVSEGFARDLVYKSVRSLIGIIVNVCYPGTGIPEDITDPEALQNFLDSLPTGETIAAG